MSVAGLERMTTGLVAKRLILSRYTGRQSIYVVPNALHNTSYINIIIYTAVI